MFTSVSRGLRPGWLKAHRAGPLAAAACLLASACAVGPNFSQPAPPRLDRYGDPPGQRVLTGDGATQTIALGQPVDPAWWRQFKSPSLDALVAAGLKNSPTLEAAKAVLEASHNQARAGAGIFFPQLSGSASAEREQYSPVRLGQAAKPSTFNLYTVTGSVAYAIDLFGGERRNVEALLAARDRQRYAEGAAWLTLTGNIVDAAIARAGYADEADALADIVDLETAQRDSLTALYHGGAGALADVLVVEQQLAIDRQSVAQARQRQAAAVTLLKTLLGLENGEVTPAAPSLADLATPPGAPVSLPSQIVRQRPDILQAEAMVHQSSAQLGVATAALFPSISITGDYGANSLSLGKLESPQGVFWGIGPAITVPIFQGGTLWFGRKAAVANLRAAWADYRQTVLAALEQTADAMKALETDAQVSAASRASFDAAAAGARLAQANLAGGIVSTTSAATQQIAADRARLLLVAARSQWLQDVVTLDLASGGGWDGAEGATRVAAGDVK